MCGIMGVVSSLGQYHAPDILNSVNQSLNHRGPDAAGIWTDLNLGVSLCHTRLSIQDLSEAGSQPMHSIDERYVLIFNGEIYNHFEIRKQLQNEKDTLVWSGQSDTETLLKSIECWGVEKALQTACGMFAFALLDRKLGKLFLARDRLGEKPLYYGWQSGCFMFASELTALKTHPAFEAIVDRGALSHFVQLGYVPTNLSIYKNIYKLEPGTFLVLDVVPSKKQSANLCRQHHYWSLKEVAGSPSKIGVQYSDDDAIVDLKKLLLKVVDQQMISDVPLGSFLSGGIDSSLITACMQQKSSRPVQSFSIGFEDAAYNEAPFAKSIARHLGTDHTELYVSAKDALDVIPSLPRIYDEPFADSSQIPTYLVSKMTKAHVTVALSGDGGDELFGGYNRTLWIKKIWNFVKTYPLPVRKKLACFLLNLSPVLLNKTIGFLQKFFPPSRQFSLPVDKFYKVSRALAAGSPEEIYLSVISSTSCGRQIVINGHEPDILLNQSEVWPDSGELEQQIMYMDAMTYLPDDILTKVDRAAMAVSLETRVPFLDPRIVEFSWSLPLDMKIRNGTGKWILREVLKQYVPDHLFERPKMGFAVPIENWLRGPLKEWAEDLLDKNRLQSDGFFHHEIILERWSEHLSGKRNWTQFLWHILMFQAWLDAEKTL